MTIKSIWLRRIHKLVGLVIGIQFLVWAVSGAAMALLDMDEVAGGEMAEPSPMSLPATDGAWPRVQAALGLREAQSIQLRQLPSGPAIAVGTDAGTRLFDAVTGEPIRVTAALAASIASAAHPEAAPAANVGSLKELTLPVRDHALPIWQVDFADAKQSAYYVSAETGDLLARRNDTWRWWDFFWMLHNMDYANRTSFNHPLIITVGFAMAWLAATGFWLLFRTMWRHDFAAVRRIRERRIEARLGGSSERVR